MQIASSRTIAASPSDTWEALMDPQVLKACVPGCESLDETGVQAYRVVIHAKVGPVSARFQGRIELSDLHKPRAYTVSFDGQGGAMGFGKGKALVDLVEVAGATDLRYRVEASVGGKLAQIGARLIDSAAVKLADDFFAKFAQHVAQRSQTRRLPLPAAAGKVQTRVPTGRNAGSTIGWMTLGRASVLAAAVLAVLAVLWAYHRSPPL